MEIRQIPLSELLLASEDQAVRQVYHYDADAIKKLSKNIQQYGLLVPLLVRANKDGFYEVIDGNRRLLALRMMGDDPERLITCVSNNEVNSVAKGMALSANVMREDMNPMDVYDVFANLVASGTNVKAIGKAFGKTKKEIAQILALGNLAPEIKQEVRDDKLGWDVAQALTMVRGHERQLAIKVEAGDSAYRVREIINRASPNLAHALFDRDEYLKRGGTILIDLFSEQQDNKPQLCEDKELFWELQNAGVEKEIVGLLDEGWFAVVDVNAGGTKTKLDLNWPWRENIKSKKERKRHTLYYELDDDGEFVLHNRVRPDSKTLEKTKTKAFEERVAEAEKADEPLETAGGKGFSMTLVEQLKHVRSVQVKAALAMNPNLAARVLLIMLINGRGGNRYRPAATDMFWSECKPLPGSIEKQPVWRTQQDEFNQLMIQGAADSWSQLLGESDRGVLDRLAYIATMAINAHYPGAGELINAILQQQPVHPRAVWQPTAEFWKQTGRAFMLKILGEIAGENVAARFKNEKVKDLAAKMEKWFTQPDKHSWLHFNGKDEPMPADMCEKFEMWHPAILNIPAKDVPLSAIMHHDTIREQQTVAGEIEDLEADTAAE